MSTASWHKRGGQRDELNESHVPPWFPLRRLRWMIGRLCEKGSPSCSRDPWISTNEWDVCGGSPPPPISQPVSSDTLGWLPSWLGLCGEPRLEPRCLLLYSVRDGRIITRPPCAHRGITAIGEIPTIGVPAPWMIPSRSRFEPTRQLGEASHLCHLSRRRRPLTARASDPGHLPVRGRIAIPPGAK